MSPHHTGVIFMVMSMVFMSLGTIIKNIMEAIIKNNMKTINKSSMEPIVKKAMIRQIRVDTDKLTGIASPCQFLTSISIQSSMFSSRPL